MENDDFYRYAMVADLLDSNDENHDGESSIRALELWDSINQHGTTLGPNRNLQRQRVLATVLCILRLQESKIPYQYLW